MSRRHLACLALLILLAPRVAADDLEARRNLLARQVEVGDYAAAVRLGRELQEQAPFDASVLLLLGEALLELEEHQEAVQVLERAARLRPGSMDAWKLLGYTRYRLEDATGAAGAMREAVRLHPPSFLRSTDGSVAFLFFAELDALPRGVVLTLALLVVLFSVILHELAHAGAATALGDPTAGALGRLTWNPLAHVDPIGTVVLPLLLAGTQAGIVFGYARPVPFWPENFRHPRLHRIVTAMAGPLSNLMVLAIAAAAGRFLLPRLILGDLPLWPVHALFLAGMINALLALLNALPIFPLDGGHLIATLLPASWGPRAERRLALAGILLIVLVLQSGVWEWMIDGLTLGMSLAFGL